MTMALVESRLSQSVRTTAAPRIENMLRMHVSHLEAVWGDLWLDPLHAFATDAHAGVAATLDLSALEEVLSGVNLEPLLPKCLVPAVRGRQLSFVGGRLCAERCLTQLGDETAVVGYGSGGEPIWPKAFRGSITHTTKHAHAAVMAKPWCSGIGIDSEHVVESGADIVAMCCTPFERATWFGDAIDPLRATLLFSAKESFYKAVYPVVRRFVDFDEVEVVAWHDHCASLYLRPRESGDLSWVPDSTCVRFSLTGASPVTVHTAVLLPPISIKGYQ